jgi:TPR repeat protein
MRADFPVSDGRQPRLCEAQYNLGHMYANGEGVQQSNVEAYKWWTLATAQGLRDAANNRDILQDAMTAEQVAEAQRLAAAWKSK